MERRYVVMGAGAVGGALGGLLAQAGARVTLVARGARFAAVRRQGLRVVTPRVRFVADATIADAPPVLSSHDIVLLCVQSQHSAAALDALSGAPDIPIVCVQNGVAAERLAAARFTRVYGAMVWSPLASPQPGCIHVHSEPSHGVVDIGCHPAGVDALVEAVTADLRKAGFDALPAPQILRVKYGKLLVNLANALEALAGPEARASHLHERVVDEALRCFAAAGIDYLPRESLLARVRDVRSASIDGRPRAGGSTWQSLDRQSGTVETAFLNGEIVELGARHGVPTPLNRALVTLAERAARERRPAGHLSLAALEDSGRG